MFVNKNFFFYSCIIVCFPQENAEVAVRDMLKEIARKTRAMTGSTKLTSKDYMDDGSPISLTVDINEEEVRHQRGQSLRRR